MTPFVIVIFGATGDLSQHKLLPALFSLYKHKQLGEKFYIVGFARRQFTDQAFQNLVEEELNLQTDPQWPAFAKNLYYQQGLFDEVEGYDNLILKLNGFDTEIGACITRMFYLATPPDNYESILQYLWSTKLSEGCGQGSEKWTRLAIEKPFGKDLETARTLDKKLGDIFEEKQIYRVDHYLGKETVQNMIAFRFANSIFEPVWNKTHIDNVQITFAEKKGVGTRGKFFDGVGMLRDVAQNHLLQLLATVAMEQPKSFSKEDVRDERAKAIKAIRPLTDQSVSDNIIRAQYTGYHSEKDIDKNSRTDTFVAMKLYVDTARFKDVPFYLRAGKFMEKDEVNIKIVFKQTCHILFKEYGCPEIGNVLTIRIQPDEGIALRMIVKNPHYNESNIQDKNSGLSNVDMKFSYHQSFGSHGVDAYEKILLDILKGDQMLFNRSDELEYSWQLISTILQGWDKDRKQIPTYAKGGWGPQESFSLIEKDSRLWL